MKKVLVLCLSVFLLCAGSAFAAKKATKAAGGAPGLSIDVGGIVGTEPASGFGSALGFTLGASMDLSSVANAPIEGRADLSYLSYKEEFTFGFVGASSKIELKYRRIPIFVGGRYLLPLQSPAKVFVEGGIEVSFDKVESGVADPFTGRAIKVEASETNLGLTPGIGISYPVSPTVSIGGNARYHIISGSYFSLGAFVGFNIP